VGVPLDEDHEHATYDPDQVATHFEAATRAALVLGEFRAPFRSGRLRSTPGGGRSTLRSISSRGGRPIHRPYPTPDGFADASLSAGAARWDGRLGEYVLDWEEIRESPDPHALALEFARSAFRHACEVCEWDPALAATAEGVPHRSGDAEVRARARSSSRFSFTRRRSDGFEPEDPSAGSSVGRWSGKRRAYLVAYASRWRSSASPWSRWPWTLP
jgi:hypothetical protein